MRIREELGSDLGIEADATEAYLDVRFGEKAKGELRDPDPDVTQFPLVRPQCRLGCLSPLYFSLSLSLSVFLSFLKRRPVICLRGESKSKDHWTLHRGEDHGGFPRLHLPFGPRPPQKAPRVGWGMGC